MRIIRRFIYGRVAPWHTPLSYTFYTIQVLDSGILYVRTNNTKVDKDSLFPNLLIEAKQKD